LKQTFSGKDVRAANTYSKSVLRAACEVAARLRPMADYFPSYESEMLSNPALVWEADRIHVKSDFVRAIVGRFAALYMDDVSDVSRSLAQAGAALGEERWAEAAELARAVVAADPSIVQAFEVLADAQLGLEAGEAAEATTAEAIRRWPERTDFRFRLARAKLLRGRKTEAMNEACAAAERTDATVAELAFAVKLLRGNRPEDAERIARASVGRFPLLSGAYQPLIKILAKAGRRQELKALLERATGLVNKEPANLVQLAEMCVEDGDLRAAAVLVSQALRRRPRDARALALKEAIDTARGSAGRGTPGSEPE
jgi:tetratricopeptide (TPR) repeat protein